MAYFLTFFKHEVLSIVIWITLLLWSIFASVFALKKDYQIIYVKMKNDVLEISSSLNEADDNYLEKTFIKRFVQMHYTYDNQNFDSNLENSSNFMSDSLWSEIQPAIDRQKEYIKDKLVTQTAVVERIVKKDFKYEITLNVVSQKNSETLNRKFLVQLEIQKTDRTSRNPFGYYVAHLTEEEKSL